MTVEILGDVAEIVMGQSPPGEYCNKNGEGMPLLNGPTEFGSHHPTPIQFTTDPRKFSKAGDILFCVRGSTTGRMNWADQDYAIGRGVAAIRHKTRAEYQPFLKALIDYHLPRLLAQATGSTFPNVSYSQLVDLACDIPSDVEQRAIAHILGALDDKIELNRQMNATLEAIARALFKSWFVDFDPVRAKAEGRRLKAEIAALFPDEFVESELGEIPKGWRVTSLHTLATLKKESVKPMEAPAKLWEHYSIPAFDVDQTPVIEAGTAIKSNKYRVPPTSVLVSKLNPQFPRVWLPDVQDVEAAICSTEFMPFVPLHETWRPFLYELMKSDIIQQGIHERLTGSTGSRQRAKPDDVAAMHVVIPNSELIESFGHVAGQFHERMLACIRESRTLAALRDTLLPKLISGELRVPGKFTQDSQDLQDLQNKKSC